MMTDCGCCFFGRQRIRSLFSETENGNGEILRRKRRGGTINGVNQQRARGQQQSAGGKMSTFVRLARPKMCQFKRQYFLVVTDGLTLGERRCFCGSTARSVKHKLILILSSILKVSIVLLRSFEVAKHCSIWESRPGGRVF